MTAGTNGTPQAQTPTADRDAIFAHFTTLFGDRRGYVGILAGTRHGKKLTDPTDRCYAWPAMAPYIVGVVAQEVAAGREVYACGHLLTAQRRIKANAAPLDALYVDGDGATLPDWLPPPTYVVESSPGRRQWYWHLTDEIPARRGEELNRRLAYAIAADKGGWDLTQALRIPGTPNRKYDGLPIVTAERHPIAPYDPDELDRVLPPAPPIAPAPTTVIDAPGTDAGDEPPVELDALGLAVWRGERRKIKPGGTGEIDRSDTLWWLACALREAGATRRTIVAGLAERDEAWGWGCYAGRPGEYERVAAKVIAKIPRPRASATSGDMAPAGVPVGDGEGDGEDDDVAGVLDPCAGVRDDLAALRAENARLRKENDDLAGAATAPASCPATLARAHRRIADLEQIVASQRGRLDLADQQIAIFRNPKLGASRSVGAALTQLFRHQAPAKPDDPAGWRAPLGRLGDLSGQSNDTCSRQVKQLGSYRLDDGTPLLHVKVIDVRGGVDTETGEIVSPHKELWVGPGTKREDFGRVLASLAPPERKAWGGRADRNVCPDHPGAGVVKRTKLIRRTEYECAACHRTIESNDETIREKSPEFVDAAPTQHDAASGDDDNINLGPEPEPARPPTPQDAGTYDHHAHRGNGYPPGKMRHGVDPFANAPDPDPPDDRGAAPHWPGPSLPPLRVPPRSRPDKYAGIERHWAGD